MENLKSKQDH